MKYRRKIIQSILIVVCLAGCMRALPPAPSVPPAPVPEKPLTLFFLVDAEDINFTDDLYLVSLDLAIERSIRYYDNSGRDKIYRVGDKLIDAGKLKETLIAFNEVLRQAESSEDLKRKIAADFDIYLAARTDTDQKALFTGYYEPLLEGSRTCTERYKYPLYRTPPDLIIKPSTANEDSIGRMQDGEFVPYFSRKEIDADGILRGRGLELIWVDDPVELFSLHIQGSGKIKLEDGTLITVTYAQNNGRPFRSVTRFMLDGGKISGRDASYRNFKTFLKGKSEQELYEILSYNERYIFFRFADNEPVGSLGEPVTPDRTIATDPDFFPQGALAFIRLRKPVFDGEGKIVRRIPFSRFVLSQDKGSAIKGPARVDLFCGFGKKAQITAGSLKEKGDLYLLLKK
jgi:membrane-bound lytic murein transglycosylase A